MHLKSGHLGQRHFKAQHFGGISVVVQKVFVLLAGAIRKIAPVIQFKRIRPVTGVKCETE